MPYGHIWQYRDLVKEAQKKRIQVTKEQQKEIRRIYAELVDDLSSRLSRYSDKTLTYRWLKDYALLSRKYFPDVNESLSGAGAAGGLGFAFLTFLHATLESGIKIVLEETKLRDYVQNADIVVTGEGRLDGQTVMGKAPIGVAKIAKEYGKPVIAFSGCVTKDAIACNEHGIDAFFPVLRSVSTLDEAMCRTNAMQNIEDTAEQVFRLIRTFSH